MQTLNLKEHRAVEYRYRGMSHQDIARHVGVPKQTIDEWFKPSRGRLSPYSEEFAEQMNKARQKQMQKLMEESDMEMVILIKLYLIRMNELLLHGEKKVKTYRNGEPILDKDGNVQYYYVPFVPRFMDVYRAWKMQRTMKGLPTDIKDRRCPCCRKRTRSFL